MAWGMGFSRKASKILLLFPQMKARPLEEKGIRVIPVALGSESDPIELMLATTNKGNLIKAGDNEDPKILGDKIMGKVIEGNNYTLVVGTRIL